MLSGLSVANVRSFQGTGWHFSTPPLTVFCGTNSAGKSTLLKVPLLLAQSVFAANASTPELRFSGGELDLGGFEALVTGHEIDRTLAVGVDVPIAFTDAEIAWWSAINEGESAPNMDSRLLGNGQEAVRLCSIFEFAKASAANGEQTAGGGLAHELVRTSIDLAAEGERLGGWRVEAVTDDRDARHYQLVLAETAYAGAFSSYGDYRFAGYEQSEDEVRLDVDLRGLLPEGVRALAPMWPDDRPRRLPLPTQFIGPLDAFRVALEQLHYLGPLRTPAERYYLTRGEVPRGMDLAGGSVPYILRDAGEQQVAFPSPAGGEVATVTLSAAVNAWLHYLRTGDATDPATESAEFSVTSTKDVLVELAITGSSGTAHYPLADSGFGYSQVLPILVRGLRMTPQETLLIEQPELHLHPGLQIRLAEFFLALARSGRQLILETHSEHLVNAIRVATAEDTTGELSTLSTIYFIDGTTFPPVVHELSIAVDGTVPEWPAAFFGEALDLTSRLLRAQRRFLRGTDET